MEQFLLLMATVWLLCVKFVLTVISIHYNFDFPAHQWSPVTTQ